MNSSLSLHFWDFKAYVPQANFERIRWDMARRRPAISPLPSTYRIFPEGFFEARSSVALEIGSGSGTFFSALSRRYPETTWVGIERSRHRAKRFVLRAGKEKRGNFWAFRGDAALAISQGIGDELIDRLYILYPCPWPKNSQRKNRWYLHPAMAHFYRVLKPGGLMIWASDQAFYLEEAKYVGQEFYKMETLTSGPLAPNEWNDLQYFPEGRSKFEASFLHHGHPCFELIQKKAD